MCSSKSCKTALALTVLRRDRFYGYSGNLYSSMRDPMLKSVFKRDENVRQGNALQM